MRLTQVLFEWVLTSAFLILAVLALRALLGKRVNAGLRYALWAVVLVRLLVPVQLFTAETSIMRETGMEQLVESPPKSTSPPLPYESSAPVLIGQPAIPGPVPNDVVVSHDTASIPSEPEAEPLTALQVFGWLWLTGSLVMAAAFVTSNASFARRLRRVRVPVEDAYCPLPVYLAESLPSPCLFGLFRPAVYVTPETVEDPAMLRHVLVHEYTHYRHGDHIWNVLRSGALVLHWWNPLVWLSVILSRRDCELACDEGALKRLGESERFAYGRTLLALITAKPRPADLFRWATTMTGGQKSVWERVNRIARSPKRWLWAAVALVLAAALACVCAFGSARYDAPDAAQDAEESQPPPEVSQLPAEESPFPEQWLDNRQVLEHHPDLNRNGVPEDLVTYDLMFYEQAIGKRLEVREGDELLWWAEDSASFCPVFLCRTEGLDYLLRYLPETSQPKAYQGPSFYQYDLLTLEEGPNMTVYQNGLRETVVQHRDIYFDFNVGKPSFTGQFDPEAISYFMVNVNYLLNKSVPLFDLDSHTQNTFDQTGHPEDTLWWLDSAEPIFTRDKNKSLLENLQAYQRAMEDYYSPTTQIPGYAGKLEFEFYAVEAGMSLRFSNLSRAVTPSDITFQVAQYTILDLDQDGATELILKLDGQGGSLVFHPTAEGIYCYHEVPRGLQNLKTDGTCRGSSGAGDWGFYRVSAFTAAEMETTYFTWCESTDDARELYFVDSVPAARREFEAATEAQSQKEDVQWQTWTGQGGGPAEVIWWLDAAGVVWLDQ